MRVRGGKRNSEQGFSMLEVLTVIALVAVLSGMAIMATNSTGNFSRANSAMYAVISQLRTARQIALTKRRNVLISFTAPNKIQLTVETLAGEAPATAIAPAYLNDGAAGGLQFYVYPGTPDTPMGFGNSSSITFTPTTGGTSGLAVLFSTQGSLVGTTAGSGYNTVGDNNPVNASIFMAIPGQPNTARAVTVMGTTGRVRSYSWTGSSWQEEQ